MINMFHQCPACGGNLIITECKCADCKLQMRGEFLPGLFSTLTEDQLTFIRVFLRARGNLSEIERLLGISYPTIRNKLDEINNALEGRGEPAVNSGKESTSTSVPDIEEARADILKKVAEGQLSAENAIQKLQDMRGGGK